MPQNQAANGVEVRALELGPQRLVDVPYRDASIYRIPAIVLAERQPLLVELVPYLADDLLDDILDRKEPLERAPLVYHDGHLKPLRTKVLEDLVDAPVLGYRQYVAHEVSGGNVRLEVTSISRGSEDVLCVYHPDDPVAGVVFEDGVAGVATLRHDREKLLEPHLGRERLNVRPGHHDLAGMCLLELDDGPEHPLFILLEDALHSGLADDEPQLLLRVGLLALRGRWHPEHPHEGVGCTVEH